MLRLSDYFDWTYPVGWILPFVVIATLELWAAGWLLRATGVLVWAF